MLDLMQPLGMPPIIGLAVPDDFYWVVQHPAPLAGMSYPSPRTPWQNIATAPFTAHDEPLYLPARPLRRTVSSKP
jgi:hypothetical protein